MPSLIVLSGGPFQHANGRSYSYCIGLQFAHQLGFMLGRSHKQNSVDRDQCFSIMNDDVRGSRWPRGSVEITMLAIKRLLGAFVSTDEGGLED